MSFEHQTHFLPKVSSVIHTCEFYLVQQKQPSLIPLSGIGYMDQMKP